MSRSFKFNQVPGHLIRRAQQLSVAIFMEETEAAGFDVTPVQFAILHALIDAPGEDQVTVAARVAFDAATFGAVIARLESRGWVRREADPGDRRRKRLWVTDDGDRAAMQMKRAVAEAQQRIVAPLAPDEQAQLVFLLDKLLAGHRGHHGNHGDHGDGGARTGHHTAGDRSEAERHGGHDHRRRRDHGAPPAQARSLPLPLPPLIAR